MKRIIGAGFILLLMGQTPLTVFGQEKSHIVYERQEFKVIGPNQGSLKVTCKYYIANEAGKELGLIVLSGDKYTTVKNLKGAVISPDGKVYRKIKKSDIMTYEGSARFNMYTDDKYQGVYLSYPAFPYYIECSFELDIESLLFWPNWFPQRSFEVKEACYTLQVPEGFGWKMRRYGKNIDSTSVAKENKILWKATNIPAWSREYRMCPEDQDTLGIRFAPYNFSVDNTTGNLETWNGLGDWNRRLSHKQNDLDEKDLIPLAIDTTQSTKEIVRQAYRFIQQNTHYYAVSPGIYGWKPHPSTSVLKNRYGDCKDLATLLTGILKVYKIPAYPAILLVRNYGVVEADFPMNRFNHMIVYVPLESETLWVDCTTNSNMLENIPDFDEGASALVVLDDTTIFRTIPESRPEANRSIFQADITIGVTGNARIAGSLTFIGDENTYFRDYMGSMDDRERKEALIRWLGEFSPNLTLTSYTLPDFEYLTDTSIVKFECSATNYASLSRNRLFIDPGFYFRINFRGEKPEKRTASVYYDNPFNNTSRITYFLPETYQVEAAPSSAELVQDFGRFTFVVQPDGNHLTIERNFQINQKKIPVSCYKEYYDFMTQCEKIDNQKIICAKLR